MLWSIPFTPSSCTVLSRIAHPPRTPIPILHCHYYFILSVRFFPLLRSVLVAPNTPSIVFLPTPPSFLRSRVLTGYPGVRHLFLCISYYDRKIAYLWSTYGFLCTFPPPFPSLFTLRVAFLFVTSLIICIYPCASLLIFSQFIIYLIVGSSYCSFLPRQLGMTRSGRCQTNSSVLLTAW